MLGLGESPGCGCDGRKGGARKGGGGEEGVVRLAGLESPARQTGNTARGQHFRVRTLGRPV
jgi:hypothetical protein